MIFPLIAGYFCFHVSLKFCHFFFSPPLPQNPKEPHPIQATTFIPGSVFSQDHITGLANFQVLHFSSSIVSVLIFHVSGLSQYIPIQGGTYSFSGGVLYSNPVRNQLHFPTSVYTLSDICVQYGSSSICLPEYFHS